MYLTIETFSQSINCTHQAYLDCSYYTIRLMNNGDADRYQPIVGFMRVSQAYFTFNIGQGTYLRPSIIIQSPLITVIQIYAPDLLFNCDDTENKAQFTCNLSIPGIVICIIPIQCNNCIAPFMSNDSPDRHQFISLSECLQKYAEIMQQTRN